MLVGGYWKKIISLFFLVFFGLNFAGLLCLSHCKDIGIFIKEQLSVSAENHAPGHCVKPKSPDNSSGNHQLADYKNNTAETGHYISGFDGCCDFTAAMIAAPFKSGLDLHSPIAITSESIALLERDDTAIPYLDVQTPLVYRPPLLDLSGTRLLNCIIQI